MVGHLGFSETVLADDLVVRNGIFFKKFTDVPFIGDVIGHQNGTVINGKRDGFWESYYDNGQLNWKGNYKAGLEEGLFEHFKENGKFEKKERWKNGRRVFK